ncbi:MAG: outer membrane protein [Candidatus Tokpelaia sp. JSC161]|jgi:hypothetical protein|nr:MAG: outer membrane protein [Candidatus Tokpelaia sp. JSC161]
MDNRLKKFFFLIVISVLLPFSGCSLESLKSRSSETTAFQAASLGHISQSTLPPPDSPDDIMEKAETGVELNPSAVAGVWKASIGGMGCQIATPQTKFGQGYRAGPMHCPFSFLNVKSWALSGSKLIFYDNTGVPIAMLSSPDGNSFEGKTFSGIEVVLSR